MHGEVLCESSIVLLCSSEFLIQVGRKILFVIVTAMVKQSANVHGLLVEPFDVHLYAHDL